MNIINCRRNLLLVCLTVYASVALIACGGSSGGGTTQQPPPTPDFSLGVQPSPVSVTQGASTTVTITLTGLNGFTGSATVTISGFSTGLSASPSQFTLSPGGQQVVSLSASAAATTGNASLTVAAQSGSISHSAQFGCAVNQSTAPVPDYALTIQPSPITLAQGSSTPVTISATSINNFAGLVNVTLSGFPAGISSSSTQFSILVPGGQQLVTISAAASAGIGNFSISVAGLSTAGNHTTSLPGTVTTPQSGNKPSLRTNYIRDDASWRSDFLSFSPQLWALYDPGTKRFFVNNFALNRIEVYDAATETQIAQIPVPSPFVGDETPDHKTIYMGTLTGDIYVIDPVAMSVTKRFPSVEIGPAGFAAFEVRVFSDGRLVLLSELGQQPNGVDGFSVVALWNPTDNSLQQYTTGLGAGFRANGAVVCGNLENIGEFSLSPDRTKILLGSADSDDVLCTFDPITGKDVSAATFQVGIGVHYILTPADGKEIIVPDQSVVTVYDSAGLFQTDQFIVGNGTTFYNYFLSADGNTLYAYPPGLGGGQVLAYDWRSHLLKGWFPTMQIPEDFISWVTPMAMDETGLTVGVTSRGVAFVDAGSILTSGLGTTQVNGFVQPSVGAVQGGTTTQIIGLFNPGAANGAFFGSRPALNVSPNLPNNVNATAPAGSPGPVNVTVTTPSNLLLIPESFSYGPWVVESVPNAATAEGGSVGAIFGYGFGPTGQTGPISGPAPSNLHVTVAGQSVALSNYAPAAFAPNPYPFPLQYFNFAIPPGTAGTSADLVVTDDSGSITVPKAIQYLPPTHTIPLPGSVLVQGIYDSRRDVYYFTDQSVIQVFSKTLGKWLSPINLPHAVAPAFNRMWGISLSPDGSKLVVSDAGTTLIYLLNPDTPATVKTFVTPSQVASDVALPGGLAVTDSGIVYYSTFYLNTTGNIALHKLDTNSGTITDYHNWQAVSLDSDAATRVLLSNDNTRIFINEGGLLLALDTATDVLSFNSYVTQQDDELTLSSNQTQMSADEVEMDTNFNLESFVVLNERETWKVSGVYGEKLSPDGNLLFSPLLNGLDVFDGRAGTLRLRIALPIALSANYDALVSDGKDNILIAITGENGDGGITVLDLTSLPEPPPSILSRVSRNNLLPFPGLVTKKSKTSESNAPRPAPPAPLPQKGSVPRIFHNLLTPRTNK